MIQKSYSHATVSIFAARVAKRAKVMFSQVFVILSLNGGGGGGGGGGQHQWSTTSPLPQTRSEHLPPPPPPTRSEHLPPPPLPLGPGENIYPLPPDQVRTSTSSPLPLGPGQNIYPLPPLWTTAPTPLPPLDNSTLPPPWTAAPTPLPPYGQWAGGTHPTGMHSSYILIRFWAGNFAHEINCNSFWKI